MPVSYSSGPAWFDGYDPNYHQTVLFDDFYGGLKWTELMQIMDRYGHQVHTKGGFVNFKPRFIIFTSNKEPAQWYPKVSVNRDMWPAFLNRVHIQIKFHKHSIGVQLQWQKGNVDDFPEGIAIPRSTNPPMRLNVAPKIAPKVQPKRNIQPVVRRVQTSVGFVDEPITLDPYLENKENEQVNE